MDAGSPQLKTSLRFAVATALVALAATVPARAEDNDAEAALNSAAVASTQSGDIPHIVVTPAARPLTDEELARTLSYNPATISDKASYRSPLKPPPRATWEGGRQDDGTSRYSVKKPIAPAWDLRAGADLTVAGDEVSVYRPGGAPVGSVPGETQGGFWAAAAVPHVADVRVHLDSGLTQSRAGADLQRTVPLGEKYSVTLQNKVAVTDTTTGVVPPPTGTAAQVWDTERKIRFNVKETGTSIAAAATYSTVDGVTHHDFSADQRIYGPLHVNGAITDPGRDTASQRIGASVTLNW
jgi:hypothetical protein